ALRAFSEASSSIADLKMVRSGFANWATVPSTSPALAAATSSLIASSGVAAAFGLSFFSWPAAGATSAASRTGTASRLRRFIGAPGWVVGVWGAERGGRLTARRPPPRKCGSVFLVLGRFLRQEGEDGGLQRLLGLLARLVLAVLDLLGDLLHGLLL